MSHDRESGSNGKKMTFGKKVSGLLSKLTKNIHALGDMGYFNNEQLIFIERYAFKVDDALEVAASYGAKVTRISQHQLDDSMNTYSSSSPLPSAACTIKSESIDAAPGVVVETVPTITAINLIQQDDTASRIVVEATPTSTTTKPIHHDDKVINNFFTTSPLATPTPGCGLNNELFCAPNQVEPLNSIQNNITSADIEPTVGADTIKLAGFLQKCAEKGVKPHCSTSQGLEANTAIGTEDNVIIENVDIPSILAITTVVTEPEVLTTTIQAEIPSNDKITTDVSDVSLASVVPDPTKFFGDGSHIENPVVTALGISETTAIVDHGSHVEETVISESTVLVVPEETANVDDSPHIEDIVSIATVVPEAATIVEDASQIVEPVILESSIEAPIPPNSESKTKATSHIKNISNTENSSKIPGRPKTENRRSRSQGMVVRFMDEGAKNGKRNITLQTSVSTAPFGPGSRQSRLRDWTTTRHYPGAVIMARENQVGSRAGNNIMPFLHIQRGDILELKEERSPSIYLVKQKWDGGLEGLIRIYRTDMKASDAAASSIHVDDSQSDKSGGRSSRETSPVTRGRGRAVVLQNKLGNSGKPGSPSPKSPTGVAIKPVIKRQVSASVNPAAEANAPKVSSPGYENAPHMIAARMYDQNAHSHVYVEEPLPKRTRYVEIWTPHLTDGQIIEPGTW